MRLDAVQSFGTQRLAYWVSFDIDVPLFLPTYAERRFHDLWILAEDEESGAMAGEGGWMDSRCSPVATSGGIG